eukprot:339715-Hanusia_phi.AAC.1
MSKSPSPLSSFKLPVAIVQQCMDPTLCELPQMQAIVFATADHSSQGADVSILPDQEAGLSVAGQT